MIFVETSLPGSFLIKLECKLDERGFFSRVFCQKEFENFGLNSNWVQINNSMSKKVGTLRGLHFQYSPHSEIKLVRCISGAIWDVIVDVRKSSPYFGKWFAIELSAENRTSLYIPQGFAHGFISLLPNTEIIYFVSSFYVPEAEGCINWNDPDIEISWPISPNEISEKDRSAPFLDKIALF